jgi:hypothetical protein
MSRSEHESLAFTEGSWRALSDMVVPRWSGLDAFCSDPPTVTQKTLMNARLSGRITVRTFHLLAQKLGRTPSQLTADLNAPKERSSVGLRIASIEDVLNWGWDGQRLLVELIQLDYATIDGLTAEHEGKPTQWAPVFMDHPDTWRLLVDEAGLIVGYWHFVPLFQAEFQLAKQGQLHDSEVTTDKVSVLLPGEHNMYFTVFCLTARMRRTPGVRILFNSFLEVLTDLARGGIFFREICANAYTPSGVALCRKFGMTCVQPHMSHGQMFAKAVFPFPVDDVFSSYDELQQLYQARFQ